MKIFTRTIIILLLCILVFSSCGLRKDTSEAEDHKYIGSPVKIGKYYNRGDHLEPLSWIVVEVTDDKVYLITAKVIDCIPFLIEEPQKDEYGHEYNHWTNSYIRRWLNNDFYNSAFSKEEKELICLEKLKIYNHSCMDPACSEEITEDHVFLMTVERAENIYSQGELNPIVSEYAKKQGVFASHCSLSGMWWLMSPGFSAEYAACVNIYGDIQNGSSFNELFYTEMTADYVGVRPMIAIDYDDFDAIYDEIHNKLIN